MKYTYKKMAGGGSVKSEKGYTAKDRKAIRSLIEELADPHSVDVTGGSSVTVIKKPKKRMAAGGMVESSKTGPAGIPNYIGKDRPAPRNPMPQRNKIRSAPGVSYAVGERGRGMAAGGIVGRPARSYRDMKAGAGSGVGRLQKTKIARGR